MSHPMFGATFGNTKGFGGNAHHQNKFNDSFDRESTVDFGFNDDIITDLNYGKQSQANNNSKNQKRTVAHLKAVDPRNPPLKSSYSDIVDKDEREAIF